MEITDVNNTLIREILSIWAEVNFEGSVKSQNQFLEEPLWHNSLIKAGNKPVFYKKLFLKGISKVKHIMRDYNKFFSLAEVSNIYNIQIQPLTFFGLVSSVRSIRTPVTKEASETRHEDFYSSFIKRRKANRLVYKKLTSMKANNPEKSQIKWDANCESENCHKPDWRKAYKLAFRCTKSTKLSNFRYRFLHRILPTNCFLTKIGLKNNSNCTFCGDFPEELCHLFWNCKKSSSFWDDLLLWLKEKAIIPDIYQKRMTVLLGLKPESSSRHNVLINFCFLIAKFFIWCCKMRETSPNIKGFLPLLSFQYRIESYTYTKENKKWDPFTELLK